MKAQSLAFAATGQSSDQGFLDNLVQGLTQASSLEKWYTNRTKAWVLNGLISFASVFESEKVSGVSEIQTSESPGHTVSWSKSTDKHQVSVPWEREDAVINVAHEGPGAPWVTVVGQSAVKLESANDQGIHLEKSLKNLTRDDGTFQPGDLIQVVLKIENSSSQSHVALNDPIPAGANILSEGWGSFSFSEKSYSGYKAYFSFLPAGESTVNYQYQLNNPGEFQLPPTRAEALYEPGFFGETPNDNMKVAQPAK